MSAMKLKHPFLTAGYAGEEYFCDRRRETAKMIAAFENDRNLTLIAPRRYGKTGLIKNALAKMPAEFTGIYLDIFSIENLASFAAAFASAVTGALDSRSRRRCRPSPDSSRAADPRLRRRRTGLPVSRLTLRLRPPRPRSTRRLPTSSRRNGGPSSPSTSSSRSPSSPKRALRQCCVAMSSSCRGCGSYSPGLGIM